MSTNQLVNDNVHRLLETLLRVGNVLSGTLEPHHARLRRTMVTHEGGWGYVCVHADLTSSGASTTRPAPTARAHDD